jgi:hypothetical protein
MLSFLSIAPQDIIGRSDSNLSNTRTSLQHSLRSMMKQGHLHVNSAAVVMRKFLVAEIQSFLHTNKSSIASSPARRQSGNGLVEAHWKIMVHMFCTYLTEKQMSRLFWYFGIKHAAKMMNVVPGKY